MNEFERLLAYLKIAYHNMTTLHRHLSDDPGWFGNHEKLSEWYEDIGEQIDDLVETGLALGYTEPSIKDAVLMYSNDIISGENRELKETLRMAMEIIRSIAGMMQAAEPIVPASVQNKLQEYEYEWNKIANYMIAHALGKSPAASEEDDDD